MKHSLFSLSFPLLTLNFSLCSPGSESWFIFSISPCSLRARRHQEQLLRLFKIFLAFLFVLSSSQCRSFCTSWICVIGFPTGLSFYSLPSPVQPIDVCSVSFSETWLSCALSLYEHQWHCCPWDRSWTPDLAFRALLLILFLTWQSHSALLASFWPHQGLFSPQPSAQLMPCSRSDSSCLMRRPPITHSWTRMPLAFWNLPWPLKATVICSSFQVLKAVPGHVCWTGL